MNTKRAAGAEDRVRDIHPSTATLWHQDPYLHHPGMDETASVSVQPRPARRGQKRACSPEFRIARAGPTNASQLREFQLTGTASGPDGVCAAEIPPRFPDGRGVRGLRGRRGLTHDGLFQTVGGNDVISAAAATSVHPSRTVGPFTTTTRNTRGRDGHLTTHPTRRGGGTGNFVSATGDDECAHPGLHGQRGAAANKAGLRRRSPNGVTIHGQYPRAVIVARRRRG